MARKKAGKRRRRTAASTALVRPAVPAATSRASTSVTAMLKAMGGAVLAGVMNHVNDGSPAAFVLGILAAGLYEGATSSRASFDAAMELDALKKTVQPRLDEIDKQIAKLRERDSGAAGHTEVANVLLAAAGVYQRAMDDKMREVAGNAAVNAFSQELYDAGMNRRLFIILGELDYGDIDLLRRIADAETKMRARIQAEVEMRGDAARTDPSIYSDLLEPFHNPYELEMMHANRLMDRGLIALMNESTFTGASRQVFPTRLGQLLLRLAREAREPN